MQSNDDYIRIAPEGAATTRCEDAWNDHAGAGAGMFDFNTGTWVESGKIPLKEKSAVETNLWEGNARCAPIVVGGEPGMVVLANIRVESQGLVPERFLGKAYLYQVASPSEPIREIDLYDTSNTSTPFLTDLITWEDGFGFNSIVDDAYTAYGFSAVTGDELWKQEGVELADDKLAMPARSAGSTLWPIRSGLKNGVLDLRTGQTVVKAEDNLKVEGVVGPGLVLYRQVDLTRRSYALIRNGTTKEVPIEGPPSVETSTSPDYLAINVESPDWGRRALKVIEISSMREVFSRTVEEVSGLKLREVDVVDHYLRLHKEDEMILLDLETGETVPEDGKAYVLAILPNGWGTAKVPSVGLRIQQALVYLRKPDEPFRYER